MLDVPSLRLLPWAEAMADLLLAVPSFLALCCLYFICDPGLYFICEPGLDFLCDSGLDFIWDPGLDFLGVVAAGCFEVFIEAAAIASLFFTPDFLAAGVLVLVVLFFSSSISVSLSSYACTKV